ncbi:hypothetical protein QQ045_025494 [Rhodiola kirilowii]
MCTFSLLNPISLRSTTLLETDVPLCSSPSSRSGFTVHRLRPSPTCTSLRPTSDFYRHPYGSSPEIARFHSRYPASTHSSQTLKVRQPSACKMLCLPFAEPKSRRGHEDNLLKAEALLRKDHPNSPTLPEADLVEATASVCGTASGTGYPRVLGALATRAPGFKYSVNQMRMTSPRMTSAGSMWSKA